MSKRSVAVKVGIFLTVIVILFVIGQLWLLRFNVGKKGNYLDIFFNDVSGLKEGDPVRVYGIKKGKVVGMDMVENGVTVKVWIEKGVDLRSDATASIQDVAMISGTKTIVMNPGTSDKPLDFSKTLQGRPNVGLSTVEIGTVATQFEDLIKVLKQGIGGGEGALKSLELTLNDLRTLIKENKEGIKEIVDKSGTNLGKTDSLVDELYITVREINRITENINSEKGTMGKLIHNEELYNNLNRASANLDSLLVEVRKNPGKYVHISVF